MSFTICPAITLAMRRFAMLAACLLMIGGLSACNSKAKELQSPCVGLEESPCGPRRAANTWMG